MDSMQGQNEVAKASNIEAILSSLDNVKRAEAPPFLYTRIQARLNSHRREFFESLSNTISKPVVAISLLFLILFMDVTVYQATYNVIPEEPEVTAESFFATGDIEEMLFYDIPDSDYVSSY
jgi:hypothetical protein